jgi:hypothetical protein
VRPLFAAAQAVGIIMACARVVVMLGARGQARLALACACGLLAARKHRALAHGRR